MLQRGRSCLLVLNVFIVAQCLITEDETPQEAALRQLKEETGLTGVVKHCSPVTCLDSGMEGGTIVAVTTDIDGDDIINKNVSASKEYIEVIHIPVNIILEKCNEYAREGIVVDSRCYTYAIALAQATKPKTLQPAQK